MPGAEARRPSASGMVSLKRALQLRPEGWDTVSRVKWEEHCRQKEQHMQRL